MTRTVPGPRARILFVLLLASAVAYPGAPPAAASDHADPINLDRLEGGITDLFVFPANQDLVRRVRRQPKDKSDARDTMELGPVPDADSNRLIIILCVRRSLTASPPFEGLDQFTYRIHADLHSANAGTFRDGDPNLARYGGTVQHPEGIDEDFKIEVVLNNDTTFKQKSISVRDGGELREKKEAELRGVRWYAGVRDDPFIFPQFFGTNVVAMVIAVPLDLFPGARQDFLFWATSHHRGTQIDHVGRSQRTQLPRFDFLNTVHPRDHIRAIQERRDDPGLIDDFLRVRIPPEFAIRPYDVHPDVMYFTRRRAAGYPNGRFLEDDVADLTCKQGDCQLFELSQSHPRSGTFPGGRPAKNDKDFSDTWPYLADPHPDRPPGMPPELTAKNRMLLILIGVAVAAVILLPWALYFWALRRVRRLRQALALYTAPIPPPSVPPVAPVPPAPAAAPGGPQP